MPVIKQRIRWTKQPHVARGIDGGNPLARGLVSVMAPPFNYDCVVKSSLSAATAMPSIAPIPSGVAYKGGSTGVGFSTLQTSITSPSATILRFGTVLRAATNAHGMGSNSGSGGFFFLLQTATNGVFMRAGDGTTSITRAFSANAATDSAQPVVLVGVVSSLTSVDAYWNGILDNGTLGSGASGTPSWKICGNTGLHRPATGTTPATTGNDVLLTCTWNRPLSASEVFEISSNPWQIFAP